MNHPSLGDLRRRARARTSASSARGQSLVEFGLILPIMVLIAIAVGDFGRIYASMIALESATREAADYGAFDEDYWVDTASQDAALAEMLRRACTAASSMPGYAGASDNSTCTNPAFHFEWNSEFTNDYGEGPIRIIMARGTFTFTTALSFPPLPESVTIVRESRFAVWKVNPLESEGPSDPPIPAPSTVPTPEPTPTPETTPEPTPTPESTPEPGPTPTPEPEATPTPTPEPEPTPTPEPDPTPTPNPNETPTPTPPSDPKPTPSDGPQP